MTHVVHRDGDPSLLPERLIERVVQAHRIDLGRREGHPGSKVEETGQYGN